MVDAGGGEAVDWVEAAAHDGSLAGDVLSALREFAPGVFERLRYTILEPFPERRRVQQERLAAWGERVTWVSNWGEFGRPVGGVVVANELLDAMPVRRFEWDRAGARWWESGVRLDAAGRLAWCRLPVDGGGPDPRGWTDALLAVLPDGYVVESSPGALRWWRAACEALAWGRVVTADYGWTEGERIRPERQTGSLRAYRRHRQVGELLACPGDQDLTAHVDFGGIQSVGEASGLVTEGCVEQGRWLGEAVVEIARGGGPAAEWLTARAGQLRTLTHPVHLGRAMRVLAQRRDLGGAAGGVDACRSLGNPVGYGA